MVPFPLGTTEDIIVEHKTIKKWAAGLQTPHSGKPQVHTYEVEVLDRPKSYFFEGRYKSGEHLGSIVGYKYTFRKGSQTDLFDTEIEAVRFLVGRTIRECESARELHDRAAAKQDAANRYIEAITPDEEGGPQV